MISAGKHDFHTRLTRMLPKTAKNCPLIINNTNHSLVVFQERGVYFNKQVLLPKEAMSVKKFLNITPYWVNVVVGDETCIPDMKKSLTNLVSVTAIPTAFVIGALSFAATAGTLTGPALALAPIIDGLVIQGLIVDTAALAAGAVLAERITKAKVIGEYLIKKHPEKFVAHKGPFFPGEKYISVTGGVQDGDLILTEISKADFIDLGVTLIKDPIP